MKISPRLSEMDNTKSSESLDEQIEASKVGEDDVIEADNIEIQDGTPRDIGPVAPMVCFFRGPSTSSLFYHPVSYMTVHFHSFSMSN